MAAQSSGAPAVARTTATKEGEEDDTRLPTLKAAAENPEGTFTSAAAEGGCEEGEGTVLALKAQPTTQGAPLRQSPPRPALQEWMEKRPPAAATAAA
jgi:hypothetical protein